MKNIIENKNKINVIAKIALAIITLGFSVMLSVKHVYATPVESTKIIELANHERIERGIKPLTIDPLLTYAATLKASDMINKKYFDHYSPTGKSPWDFIKESGYIYTKAGENLAMDFRTSEGTNRAWMESASHRANMLNPDFENIAIVVVEGELDGHETTLVVEMLGKPNISEFSSFNYLLSKISGLILGF